MKAFIIAICLLILITAYIISTSSYFLKTEIHLSSSLRELDDMEYTDPEDFISAAESLDELYEYLKKRNKILSLYIHQSKCSELEHLIRKIQISLLDNDIELFNFFRAKFSDAMHDIRKNDASLTLSGIT